MNDLTKEILERVAKAVAYKAGWPNQWHALYVKWVKALETNDRRTQNDALDNIFAEITD